MLLVQRNKGERSGFGELLISHKGKQIPTSVGSRSYEAVFGGQVRDFPRTRGNIPLGYHHRPDLISNLFLGNPNSWWVVCERNAIFDIFEQLNSGDSIQIPIRL